MSHVFTSTRLHQYKTGQLFLGLDPETGHEVGISTERHAITIAGSGSGKGSALIVPNLLRWPHNILCIDPKGENAEASWKAREAMGQTVHVIDPFKKANVPERLRASVNLLDEIDPASLTAREDIRCIADGCVMRHNPKNAQWDDAALKILAGVFAHVRTTGAAGMQTLLDAREILTLPHEQLTAVLTEMQGNPLCGGLARDAGTLGLASLEKRGDGPEAAAISGARENSEWLSSDGIQSVLGESTFRLSDLKKRNCTVFLVLPLEYLSEHGRFLRLFVRCALDAMMKGPPANECLFILDEFYSLGRIDQIAKAIGTMRSSRLHLWPFMQDLEQLASLYEGISGTFFSNCDAQIFFGNSDPATLQWISERLGKVTLDDLEKWDWDAVFRELESYRIETYGEEQPWWANDEYRRNKLDDLNSRRNMYEKAESRFRQENAQQVGQPRFPPDVVRNLLGKKDGDDVARSMIVFAKGNDKFNLELAPFFKPPRPPRNFSAALTLPKPSKSKPLKPVEVFGRAIWCGGGLFAFFAILHKATADIRQAIPQPLSGIIGLLVMLAIVWLLWKAVRLTKTAFQRGAR